MIIRCDFCGTANSDRDTHCKSCGAALNLSNDFLEKQRNEVEKLNKIDSIADADVRKTKGVTTAILAIIIGMPILTFLGFAFIFAIIYVIDCVERNDYEAIKKLCIVIAIVIPLAIAFIIGVVKVIKKISGTFNKK